MTTVYIRVIDVGVLLTFQGFLNFLTHIWAASVFSVWLVLFILGWWIFYCSLNDSSFEKREDIKRERVPEFIFVFEDGEVG